MLPQKDSTFGV